MNKTPKGCKATECGFIGKVKVQALTDSAGTQVVIFGGGVHKISRSFATHKDAEAFGRELVEKKCFDQYDGWYDLKIKGKATMTDAMQQLTQVFMR